MPCCFLFVAVRCAPWWFTQKGCGLMLVALVIPDVCTCVEVLSLWPCRGSTATHVTKFKDFSWKQTVACCGIFSQGVPWALKHLTSIPDRKTKQQMGDGRVLGDARNDLARIQDISIWPSEWFDKSTVDECRAKARRHVDRGRT